MSFLQTYKSRRGLSFVFLIAGSILVPAGAPAQEVSPEQALLSEPGPADDSRMSVPACLRSDSVERGAEVDGERALLNDLPPEQAASPRVRRSSARSGDSSAFRGAREHRS
jgi:hypothetical protein